MRNTLITLSWRQARATKQPARTRASCTHPSTTEGMEMPAGGAPGGQAQGKQPEGRATANCSSRRELPSPGKELVWTG